jgi:hypothetical protein
MPICGVPRPPHRLGGVARSRSLFVATPPPILGRGKLGAVLLKSTPVGNGLKPFPTKDFGRPRERDFTKVNLHLGIFDQPQESDFFDTL